MQRSMLPFAAVLLVLTGCGATTGQLASGRPDSPPASVTDENVHEVERVFWSMDPSDPARTAWRDALVRYRSRRSDEVIARGDYDEVVEHLAKLAELLHPSDIEAGRVPAEVAPLARWIVEHGASRGDEGRVMGALVLLSALGESSEEMRAERERVATWGRDARAGIQNPIERYGDLIQVWEQQEQIAPAPDVLSMLARLYTEQRDALLATFGLEGQGSDVARGMSFHELQLAPRLVERAPLDVAAVYLRHGDLGQAIEHVRRMGDRVNGVERELLSILSRAQRDDEGGAHALEELSRGFVRARPDISAAICRLGLRRFSQDARFPLCLARASIELGRPAESTGWYAEAVQLAPDEREVYDEAIGRLDELMEEGELELEGGQGSSIARHALEILDERIRRWPNEQPAVTREALLLSIGRAEMSQGNVEEARTRFRASLAAHETREAHQQLGLLLERVGQSREAAEHYRRALDMTEQRGAEGEAERAELLEQLGDAFRQDGNEAQARRMYTQALGTWNELAQGVSDARRSVVHVRRGVLMSRLGDEPGAARAFAAALESAPAWREPYAAILSHLVVASPNLSLAEDVMRRAQYQLTLEPEWRVYFALWVQAIAARSAAQADGEVRALLADLSRGDSWTAQLAAFGSGDRATLVDAASSRGQRAEAHFYEGARLLGAGDVASARQHFEQVLETNMVSFYEYAMAQELLRVLGSSEGRVAESP
jgi:tetratricopeptide (TPR) repeat protein